MSHEIPTPAIVAGDVAAAAVKKRSIRQKALRLEMRDIYGRIAKGVQRRSASSWTRPIS